MDKQNFLKILNKWNREFENYKKSQFLSVRKSPARDLVRSSEHSECTKEVE